MPDLPGLLSQNRPMNTPSHFLMTAGLRKALPGWNMTRSAVLLGSVAPDIPLYLLTFGGLFYFRYLQGWQLSRAARHIFDRLYFHDPIWIGLHNLLHSPLSLALMAIACVLIRRKFQAAADWLLWFLAACALHSIVDILTHYDDGPLLLWPLHWQWRFSSPLSYWDPNHFGREFSWFELGLDLALIVYLVVPSMVSRLKRGTSESTNAAKSEC